MTLRRSLTAFAVVISVFIFGHSPAFAQLFAVLLGGNEVSQAGGANAGDPDGRGTASVVFLETELCYTFLVTGIDTPTQAHIHEGAAGINGPISVILAAPETAAPGTVALQAVTIQVPVHTSSDCVPVDATLLNNIRQNPTGFYVNVHNNTYPDGAVRGQLF